MLGDFARSGVGCRLGGIEQPGCEGIEIIRQWPTTVQVFINEKLIGLFVIAAHLLLKRNHIVFFEDLGRWGHFE